MTSFQLADMIRGINIEKNVCGSPCIDAEKVRDLCIKHGREDIAATIDIKGSPWAAECAVKNFKEKL